MVSARLSACVASLALVASLTTAISCGGKQDVVLVFDSSGSISTSGTPSEWDQELDVSDPRAGWVLDHRILVLTNTPHPQFLRDMVVEFDVVPDGDHIGLVQFAVVAGYEPAGAGASGNLQDDETALLTTVDNVSKFGSGTNIAMGLAWAENVLLGFGRGGAIPMTCILITDGANTRDYDPGGGVVGPITQADQMRANGIEVFAVGVGDGVDDAELDGIAGDASHRFDVQDFNALAGAVTEIVSSTCCPNCDGTSGICDYETGVCYCDNGFTGENCGTPVACPDNCSGRGKCVEGQCRCKLGWSGPSCAANYGGPVVLVAVGVMAAGALAGAGVMAFAMGFSAKGLLGALQPAPVKHMNDTNLTTASTPGMQQDKPLMSPASRSVPTTTKNHNAAFTIL